MFICYFFFVVFGLQWGYYFIKDIRTEEDLYIGLGSKGDHKDNNNNNNNNKPTINSDMSVTSYQQSSQPDVEIINENEDKDRKLSDIYAHVLEMTELDTSYPLIMGSTHNLGNNMSAQDLNLSSKALKV